MYTARTCYGVCVPLRTRNEVSSHACFQPTTLCPCYRCVPSAAPKIDFQLFSTYKPSPDWKGGGAVAFRQWRGFGAPGTLESGKNYSAAKGVALSTVKQRIMLQNKIKTCIIGYLTIKYKVKWFIFIL